MWIEAIYLIGVLASVYHLANGIWTMGITWGVWTSPRARRSANYLAAAVGILLTVVGIGTFAGMITLKPETRPAGSTGKRTSPLGKFADWPEQGGDPAPPVRSLKLVAKRRLAFRSYLGVWLIEKGDRRWRNAVL